MPIAPPIQPTATRKGAPITAITNNICTTPSCSLTVRLYPVRGTDHLITAILRPGTAHASRGIVSILKRVVRAIRARWPQVQIEFRGDSGFAIPALYDYLEDQEIGYTIGLATNSRLEALAAPQLAEATRQYAETGEKVRLLGESQYAAGTWDHKRRVIIKTEILTKGPNVRFTPFGAHCGHDPR